MGAGVCHPTTEAPRTQTSQGGGGYSREWRGSQQKEHFRSAEKYVALQLASFIVCLPASNEYIMPCCETPPHNENFIVCNDSACYGHAVKYLFQERNCLTLPLKTKQRITQHTRAGRSHEYQ